jgi:hypothetical protein
MSYLQEDAQRGIFLKSEDPNASRLSLMRSWMQVGCPSVDMAGTAVVGIVAV